MTTLNEIKDRVLGQLKKQELPQAALRQRAFGGMIGGILGMLLELFKGCTDDPSKAAGMARRPNLRRRLQLRAVVREALAEEDDKFARYDPEIGDALIAVGKTVTDEEMEDLFDV